MQWVYVVHRSILTGFKVWLRIEQIPRVMLSTQRSQVSVLSMGAATAISLVTYIETLFTNCFTEKLVPQDILKPLELEREKRGRYLLVGTWCCF